MKRRPSRWLRSCAMLASFCLLVVFLAALVISENAGNAPASLTDLTGTESTATTFPLQSMTPVTVTPSSLFVSTMINIPTTPAFVGGAGLVLTSDAVVQSTKVEAYRDRIRATWTAAAQTMEPVLAQMTLTATVWEK